MAISAAKLKSQNRLRERVSEVMKSLDGEGIKPKELIERAGLEPGGPTTYLLQSMVRDGALTATGHARGVRYFAKANGTPPPPAGPPSNGAAPQLELEAEPPSDNELFGDVLQEIEGPLESAIKIGVKHRQSIEDELDELQMKYTLERDQIRAKLGAIDSRIKGLRSTLRRVSPNNSLAQEPVKPQGSKRGPKGPQPTPKRAEERKQQIVDYLKEHGQATSRELREHLGLSQTPTDRFIAMLREDEKIRLAGQVTGADGRPGTARVFKLIPGSE